MRRKGGRVCVWGGGGTSLSCTTSLGERRAHRSQSAVASHTRTQLDHHRHASSQLAVVPAVCAWAAGSTWAIGLLFEDVSHATWQRLKLRPSPNQPVRCIHACAARRAACVPQGRATGATGLWRRRTRLFARTWGGCAGRAGPRRPASRTCLQSQPHTYYCTHWLRGDCHLAVHRYTCAPMHAHAAHACPGSCHPPTYLACAFCVPCVQCVLGCVEAG